MSGISLFIVFIVIPVCILLIDYYFKLENLFYRRRPRPKSHRREIRGKDTEFEDHIGRLG